LAQRLLLISFVAAALSLGNQNENSPPDSTTFLKELVMKSALYTLVAVAALTLGGVFTSTAMAGPPGYHHHHGPQAHHHHGHVHNHGYRGPYQGGWAPQRPPVYRHPAHIHNHYYRQPIYTAPSGLYLQGRNFGFRIGF
jgi:hypothetical protein